MKWEEVQTKMIKKWSAFSLKNLRKDQLLILLLSGILLMVITVPSQKKESAEKSVGESQENAGVADTDVDEKAYTTYLENRLSQVLSQIEGAGDVEVMITLKSSSEHVLDKDVEADQESVTESDSQGGTRQSSKSSKKESTVYGNDSQDAGTPYIKKTISPQIGGVIVIASGGGNAVVKENISSAVQALFDVEPHKIKIMKKAGG